MEAALESKKAKIEGKHSMQEILPNVSSGNKMLASPNVAASNKVYERIHT